MLKIIDTMRLCNVLFDAQESIRNAGRELEYGTPEYKENNAEYYRLALIRAKLEVIEAELRVKDAEK